MKRPVLAIIAALAIAGSLPTSATAQGRGRWERVEQRERGPEVRRGGPDRARGWERAPGRGRAIERGYERDRRYDGRNAYGPPPGAYAPPRTYGLRRGGYLPPEARGAPVDDYPRYRLRAPPPGYRWMEADGAFMMVDPEGRIFDMIR
jgi:Ni/Co efflux regulator RcnB